MKGIIGKSPTNMDNVMQQNQNQEIVEEGGGDKSARSGSTSPVVAVAVDRDKNSKYAVKWALDHLVSEGGTVALIHVRPRILSIPTPLGSHVPITQLCDDVVAAYLQQVESETYEKLLPYQRLCNSKKVQAEIMVIEDNDIPKAIVEHISNSSTEKIVMGLSSRNAITRRFKPLDVPASVSKIAPNFCTVYVISKGKLSSVRSAVSLAPRRGTPGDIGGHSRFDSDTSSCNYPSNWSQASGRTESEGKESNLFHLQYLSPQRRKALSTGNQIMRHSISNPGITVPHDELLIPKSDSSSIENSEIPNTSRSQLPDKTESFEAGSSLLRSSVAVTQNFELHSMPNIEGRGYSDWNKAFQARTDHTGLPSIAETSNPENERFIETSNTGPVMFCSPSEVATSKLWRASNTETASISNALPKSLDGSNINVNKRPVGSRLSAGDFDESSVSCEHSSTSSSQSMFTQEEVGTEVKMLKLELEQTWDLYRVACEEATYAKQTAREVCIQRGEETRKLEAAKAKEQPASAMAAEDTAQHEASLEEAKAARKMAEIESHQRRNAEFIDMRESEERKKAEDALTSAGQRYKKYSIEEIENATDFFAESLKIGEGSYGSVYKCTLDHTTVAIKVLRPDAAQGWQQFQKEVEVLSHIHHPHMVLLLGACPEFGCLVYEYMANGSLEDRLFRRGATPSLPWSTRFRIASEVATGLLFLHSSKPEPFVHRDLKPANILLDQNFISKIGDVGLARLVPPSASCSFTEYRNTTTAGTFCYIDPEYQRTGTLGTKSDLYALGVMLLQLLTAKPPMGLAHDVERAVQKGTFKEILDQTVGDWPVEEALSLAKVALKCVEMRRRDRPDLETVVLPELQRLKALAEGQFEPRRVNNDKALPRHFFGSILQLCRKTASGEYDPPGINPRKRPSKLSSTRKFGVFFRKIF